MFIFRFGRLYVKLGDDPYGKVITIEANHYLYRTEAKEIAEKFKAYMTEIK
ncbi:hypothetical protein GCM10010918_26430 [Paenibacillus radicis (ex Gao et al. 2016)]|uniref:Uncharacterized protein n=1 Tax=Paenibacillus radicis (ex Gao et al. 2016) TaxID=1737354 RepID=A0A917LZV2_9BACL|nr:hypothetical protein GCM10010918_26430 [Paenibacillus radicis (ex Gao et al. 2016)]